MTVSPSMLMPVCINSLSVNAYFYSSNLKKPVRSCIPDLIRGRSFFDAVCNNCRTDAASGQIAYRMHVVPGTMRHFIPVGVGSSEIFRYISVLWRTRFILP
jgi:hypothetical protein